MAGYRCHRPSIGHHGRGKCDSLLVHSSHLGYAFFASPTYPSRDRPTKMCLKVSLSFSLRYNIRTPNVATVSRRLAYTIQASLQERREAWRSQWKSVSRDMSQQKKRAHPVFGQGNDTVSVINVSSQAVSSMDVGVSPVAIEIAEVPGS